MPGLTAVSCSVARVARSPAILTLSAPTFAAAVSSPVFAVDSAVPSCCRAWISVVWSVLTFCSSWLHAEDDAPVPAQAFFSAAWSMARVDLAALTLARAAATAWRPAADASDSACSSADSACWSAATVCSCWLSADALVPDGAAMV